MSTRITTIGVVGAGTMGAGIAQAAASSGFEVRLIDAEMAYIDRGIGRITSDLDKGVERSKVSAEDREATLARIEGSTDYGRLADCELVIEAVPETLAIKQPVFEAIAAQVDDDCIIASNTSSISIKDLSTFVPNPERVIGMHFFNPVPRMALVEVVVAESTDEGIAGEIEAVARAMGKTPVQSIDSPGFIVNRLLIPMINEAVIALEAGVASAEDIDTAMRLGAAHPMGPLALADMIGLDVVLDIMNVLETSLGEKYAPAPLLSEMVQAGKLGKKSGEGFFQYEGGGR